MTKSGVSTILFNRTNVCRKMMKIRGFWYGRREKAGRQATDIYRRKTADQESAGGCGGSQCIGAFICTEADSCKEDTAASVLRGSGRSKADTGKEDTAASVLRGPGRSRAAADKRGAAASGTAKPEGKPAASGAAKPEGKTAASGTAKPEGKPAASGAAKSEGKPAGADGETASYRRTCTAA